MEMYRKFVLRKLPPNSKYKFQLDIVFITPNRTIEDVEKESDFLRWLKPGEEIKILIGGNYHED